MFVVVRFDDQDRSFFPFGMMDADHGGDLYARMAGRDILKVY